jgi:hypothetical protein
VATPPDVTRDLSTLRIACISVLLTAICFAEASANPTLSFKRMQGTSPFVHLSIAGMSASVQYDLQRSFNLEDWTVIGSVNGGSGAISIDDGTIGTASQAFYQLVVSTSSPSHLPTQDIWISMRTDGLAGSGTQADPFDGSTMNKFDAILLNYQLTPNLGVHLSGAGPFRTRANHSWIVQPGWVVSGDGMYSTTIQVGGNVAGLRGVTVFSANSNLSADNITIRDLTIDCNWAELSATADTGLGGEKNISVSAVGICGSNNLLARIRCINSYGTGANRLEHFALFLAGQKTGDGINDVIQDCRAELPQGTYGNPFALAGWTFTTPKHLLTNSKAIRNTAVGVRNGAEIGFTSGGVNLANVKNCQIDSNSFTDCFGTAYIDTGSVDGLQITNNTVVRGWQGVGLSNAIPPKQNITISGNTFLIQNRLTYSGVYGIVTGTGTTTNLTISNNTITFDTSGVGIPQYYGIWATILNTATVSNNTIGYAPGNTFFGDSATGTGVTIFGNHMTDGAPVPGLP